MSGVGETESDTQEESTSSLFEGYIVAFEYFYSNNLALSSQLCLTPRKD